jgi:hypothetical protein
MSSDTHTPPLDSTQLQSLCNKPLTGAQLAEKRELAEAYSSTWVRNHLHKQHSASSSARAATSHGSRALSAAPLAELAPLFDKVADIVTRIRAFEAANTKSLGQSGSWPSLASAHQRSSDSAKSEASASDSEDDDSCCPATTIEGSAAELLLTESSHPLFKSHAQPMSLESVTGKCTNDATHSHTHTHSLSHSANSSAGMIGT